MGTAMYRPWVCRAKLGGQRSVNRSERSQRPPLVDQRSCELSIGIQNGGFRCETSRESRPQRLL
jgi:hypothetical protein